MRPPFFNPLSLSTTGILACIPFYRIFTVTTRNTALSPSSSRIFPNTAFCPSRTVRSDRMPLSPTLAPLEGLGISSVNLNSGVDTVLPSSRRFGESMKTL